MLCPGTARGDRAGGGAASRRRPSPTARRWRGSGRWSVPRAAIRRCSTPPPLSSARCTRPRSGRSARAIWWRWTPPPSGSPRWCSARGAPGARTASMSGWGSPSSGIPGSGWQRGEPLFLVHHRPGQDVAEVHRRLAAAVRLADAAEPVPPLLLGPDGGGRRMSVLFEQLQASAAAVRALLPGVAPEVALVLGQRAGWSGAAARRRREPSPRRRSARGDAERVGTSRPARVRARRLGPGGRAPGPAAHLRGLDGGGDRLPGPAARHARGPGAGAHQRLGRGP